LFELGTIRTSVQSSISGSKVEPEARPFLLDGECLTRGSGESENNRILGTIAGGRVEFGDTRALGAVGDIAIGRSGRVRFQTRNFEIASARRARLNRRLVRLGLEPLPPLTR
jgi:hypothetical protein